MTDIEASIERDLQHAQYHGQGRHYHSWALALIASRTVGRRVEGLTKYLAQELGLASVDPVEHWAKAWRMFELIRSIAGRKHANIFRQEFSVSHFYVMWDYKERYGFITIVACHYFEVLLQHKNNGDRWSVDALKMLIMADYEHKPVNPQWYITRIDSYMDLLVSFDGELEPERKRIALDWIALRDSV